MNQILFENAQLISVNELKQYDKNPRKGNVQAIAESLKENKQYRPIVVQKGTHKILAGNHTYLAAKKLGWAKISVVMVDVNDDEAKKIVLADNRTNDLAEYDASILNELLQSLATPTIGTGYSDSDLELLSSVAETAATEGAVLGGLAAGEAVEAVSGTMVAPSSAGDFDFDGPDVEAPDLSGSTEESFEDAQAELQGVLQLNDDVFFDLGQNFYDIPPLRKDLLIEEVPDSFITWGGPDASTDDGHSTYIWNYGLASPTGLPYDRAMVCFYTYDFKFEGWWDKTAYYAAKCMNKGLTMAFVPDFSVFWDDPKIYQLYSMYRGQWVGRFLQEAGIRVIPRVTIHTDMEMLKASWLGTPIGAPVIAGSFQNMDKHDPISVKAHEESLVANAEHLKPEKYIVYGGRPAKALCEKMQPKVDCELIWIENYAGVRRGVAFGNFDGIEGEKKKKRLEEKEQKQADQDAAKAKLTKPRGLVGG
jgi:hypothetical protein